MPKLRLVQEKGEAERGNSGFLAPSSEATLELALCLAAGAQRPLCHVLTRSRKPEAVLTLHFAAQKRKA